MHHLREQMLFQETGVGSSLRMRPEVDHREERSGDREVSTLGPRNPVHALKERVEQVLAVIAMQDLPGFRHIASIDVEEHIAQGFEESPCVRCGEQAEHMVYVCIREPVVGFLGPVRTRKRCSGTVGGDPVGGHHAHQPGPVDKDPASGGLNRAVMLQVSQPSLDRRRVLVEPAGDLSPAWPLLVLVQEPG